MESLLISSASCSLQLELKELDLASIYSYVLHTLYKKGVKGNACTGEKMQPLSLITFAYAVQMDATKSNLQLLIYLPNKSFANTELRAIILKKSKIVV